MELYPKQYKDLCDHENDAYAGTIYNGDKLVDIYFLYGKYDRSDIGVCIREGDNDPSEYGSGSLDQYICQINYGNEGIPLDAEAMYKGIVWKAIKVLPGSWELDAETMYKGIVKLKHIRIREQFRLNVLALFFKWAKERSLVIEPKLIHRESTFSKSLELYEYEYKKRNEDRSTTTNRDMVA